MKKIKVSLRKKLRRGTLLWINASNGKVYRSSKRFDTASFNDHDSNYVGEAEKVFLQQSLINTMLQKADRIYGVCLKIENKQEDLNEDSLGDKVRFFPTWEQMITFANTHFSKTDEVIKRKEEARREWLDRGRLYVQKKNAAKSKTSNG